MWLVSNLVKQERQVTFDTHYFVNKKWNSYQELLGIGLCICFLEGVVLKIQFVCQEEIYLRWFC